ncbi:MAG: glyoxylate/hydroxypyruvate reductase A [Chitinophagales bacterium]|jgi:glyoxylate/hydroxypyruvate reductase A
MAILLNNHGYDNAPWVEALGDYLPQLPIYQFPNIPNPEDIHYAVVWHHPHGDLINYPNLKAVMILGAGTDHVDQDPELPDVPLVRLLDPDVGNDMAQYACYWTMHFHRQYERYRQQKSTQHWQRHEVTRSVDFTVSILGLGLIGSLIAERIALNGYKTLAWNRSQKNLAQVVCHSGVQRLKEVLAISDVVINCLPLSAQTYHLLNKSSLSQLPKGASLINVSRGAVIDDTALIGLLESGHIAAAALDVFVDEPLPAESPYWYLDNVFVTPHTAGATYPKSAARVVADNILRVENGQMPFPIHRPKP